jgi:hypothetical protein
MDSEKPPFRRAQILSEPEAEAAVSSGDPERIRLALIDGSRCLDDAWTMRHAPALAVHPDAEIRWAAVFALDQARATWVPSLRDDFELIHLLENLVTNDPDGGVRSMVATVFGDVIGMLLHPR